MDSSSLWSVGAVAFAGRRLASHVGDGSGAYSLFILSHNEQGPTLFGAREALVPADPEIPPMTIGGIYHMRLVEGEGMVPSFDMEGLTLVSWVDNPAAVTEWTILDAAYEAVKLSENAAEMEKCSGVVQAIDQVIAPARLFLSSSKLDEKTRHSLRMLILSLLMERP